MKDIDILDSLAGSANRISIAVHTHPDGDAAGSGTAMLSYLEARGKDAVLIFPDNLPHNLSFIVGKVGKDRVMTFGEDGAAAVERVKDSDLIFCLDCNSFNRTGGMEDCLRASGAKKVLIDHHLFPETESFDLVFSETEISSACELLYRILMEMPDIRRDATRLPAVCAAALMTGMTTDTNNFNNSAYPSTFRMAGELLQAGVDRNLILSRLYNNERENRLRLLGCLLSEKLKITSCGAAYMILDKATQERFGFLNGESEGFVNMPLSVASVRLSIFLTEDDGFFRVSIRSKRGTSANALAQSKFNGGGHELASGGRLYIGKDISSPEEAEAYILKATEEFLGK